MALLLAKMDKQSEQMDEQSQRLHAKIDEQGQQLHELTRQQSERQDEIEERVAGLQKELVTVQTELYDRLKAAEGALTDLGTVQTELASRQKSLKEELRGELVEKLPAVRNKPAGELRADASPFVPAETEPHYGGEDPLGDDWTTTGDGGASSSERRTGAGYGGATLQRPAPYDGKSSWDAYRTQYEMLAGIHRWSDNQKATYLAVSLRGAAATVLTNLPPEQRRDYKALAAALDSRFGSLHQKELNRMRLKTRTRRREETLPELAEDVERLTRLAYPDATEAMIEVLAKDQFIDSLPEEDMRLRIRQSRPESLRKALEAALELESYQLASKQRSRMVREVRLEDPRDPKRPRQQPSLEDREDLLQQLITTLKKCFQSSNPGRHQRRPPRRRDGQTDRSHITCWNCKEKGHLRRDCQKKTMAGDTAPAEVSPPGNGQ